MDTIKAEKGKTLMVAHRGVSGIETENTAASFVAAGNRSYFGIETDVHVTKDGKFIICHDEDTKRVAGVSAVCEETDFETLRNIRLFDRKTDFKRADLVLPSVEEYISICKKYGKTAVLELKCRMQKQKIGELIGIIKNLGYLENVIFISFSWENLVDVRAFEKNQRVQFLTCEYSDELLKKLKKEKFDIDIAYPALTKEAVDAFHSEGIKINCWTCDDKAEAKKLASWGVEYITSNILE